ncbi:MAG: DUF2807 domain-containing protein [Planctomycetes bacterium]|nr:DUF2807 domain-containing protein [Planctomycetota bacterium]
MTPTRRLALVLALAALPLAAACVTIGCPYTHGNGQVVEERRAGLEGFDRVEAGGALHLVYEPSEVYEVVVRTDSNLQELVRTEVRGHALRVSTRHSYGSDEGVTVTVRAPELRRVEGSGFLELDLRGVEGLTLDLEFSGAVDGAASGRVDECRLDASGACDLDLRALVAQVVRVEASGACDLVVRAEERLEVDASGACDVSYLGSPALVLHQSGTGDVRALVE